MCSKAVVEVQIDTLLNQYTDLEKHEISLVVKVGELWYIIMMELINRSQSIINLVY